MPSRGGAPGRILVNRPAQPGPHTHLMKLLLAAGVMLAGSPLFAQGYGPDWLDDFDKAVAVAKKENKDLLVDFTGSDW